MSPEAIAINTRLADAMAAWVRTEVERDFEVIDGPPGAYFMVRHADGSITRHTYGAVSCDGAKSEGAPMQWRRTIEECARAMVRECRPDALLRDYYVKQGFKLVWRNHPEIDYDASEVYEVRWCGYARLLFVQMAEGDVIEHPSGREVDIQSKDP